MFNHIEADYLATLPGVKGASRIAVGPADGKSRSGVSQAIESLLRVIPDSFTVSRGKA